jgi:hypothetical protein
VGLNVGVGLSVGVAVICSCYSGSSVTSGNGISVLVGTLIGVGVEAAIMVGLISCICAGGSLQAAMLNKIPSTSHNKLRFSLLFFTLFSPHLKHFTV